MTAGRAKPRLVIAEDDLHFQRLMVSAAERSGEYAEVHAAPDGIAAVDLVQKLIRESAPGDGPLFVLSDIAMPRMDGLEFIRTMKRDPALRNIPIAIMTASNRPNDREDARAAGCAAFYYKPERLDQLMTLVASLPRVCAA